LNGIAYLYIRLSFSSDAFPNGVPEITATIKGKKFMTQEMEQLLGQITQPCVSGTTLQVVMVWVKMQHN
jgi:hypothetical protein